MVARFANRVWTACSVVSSVACTFIGVLLIVPSGKKLYNDGDDWLLKEREDESSCRKSSTFSNG